MRISICLGLMLFCCCANPSARARRVEENQALRRDNQRLERQITQKDATIASLQNQVDALQGFEAGRPVALFAPSKVAIGTLSGGVNLDGNAGDDGVRIYLRLLDADGDAVKVPGRISVQLLDNSDLSSPRVVGLYRFDDPKSLRASWYGKLGTSHYALECPFPAGHALESDRVTVNVQFEDFLTGRVLSVTEEVKVHIAR